MTFHQRFSPSCSAQRQAVLLGSCLGGVLFSLAIPRNAAADSALSNDGDAASYAPPPAERRDGFTIGLVQHVGFVALSGYPNRLATLGDPDFRSSPGAQVGTTGGLWLGGALRDWLTVGIGVTSAASFDDQPQSATQAFILHLEGFPAFSLGGFYRDLGVFLDVGTGVGTIERGNETLADGGSLAYLGGGVFFEPFRFWHFSTGPSLSYSHQFSQTLTGHVVGLGWRFVFYGVQPDGA